MKVPRFSRYVWIVLGVIALGVVYPRLVAEYYYFQIVRPKADLRGIETEVAAFHRLENMGPWATPVLLRLLKDEDSSNRQFAAEALENARGEKVVAALIAVVQNDPNENVRYKALYSIGGVGGPRALEFLSSLGPTKVAAYAALSRMGDEGTEVVLGYLRSDVDRDSRYYALYILCSTDNEIARGATVESLKDRDWRVQVQAAKCSSKLFREEAVGKLEDLLQDPSLQVRIQASEELGKLGNKSGAPVATEIAADTSLEPKVRGEAAHALGFIRDCSVLTLLRDLGDDPAQEVRSGAATALRSLQSSCGRPALREKDVAEFIRTLEGGGYPADSALTELRTYGPAASAAVLAVISLLESDDPRRRRKAASALGTVSSNETVGQVVPVLISLLDDADRDIRVAAVYSLTRIGPAAKSAVPAPKKRLSEEGIRNDVRSAIEKIEGGSPPRDELSTLEPIGVQWLP